MRTLQCCALTWAKEYLKCWHDALRLACQDLVQISHFCPFQGFGNPPGTPAPLLFCFLKHKLFSTWETCNKAKQIHKSNQPSSPVYNHLSAMLGVNLYSNSFSSLLGGGKLEPGARKQAGKLYHISKPTDLVEMSLETPLFLSQILLHGKVSLNSSS